MSRRLLESEPEVLYLLLVNTSVDICACPLPVVTFLRLSLLKRRLVSMLRVTNLQRLLLESCLVSVQDAYTAVACRSKDLEEHSSLRGMFRNILPVSALLSIAVLRCRMYPCFRAQPQYLLERSGTCMRTDQGAKSLRV